jgi:alkanesulfonate monooxygenase SsuD/methylene tetrahydromethanopterin reductase-like flavin-dependent oxidoreductase (luciferase family)
MVNPVGVLLPNGVPGCAGETITTWARVADDGPFTSLGTADRYVYVNHEPMMTMAAVAATTTRIRLLTAALIPALRPAPLFAKQVATLTQLAPGRVTLGIAVGNRRNDYDEAALDFTARGRVLDENLAYLDRLRDLQGEENAVGPQLGDVEILIGGASKPALRRLLSHGDGLVSGGLKPEVFAFEAFGTVEAWKAAGKPGRPRLVASTWYASSTDTDDLAAARLASYLKNGGPPPHVISGIARGRAGVEEAVAAFRAQGADEVIFFPLLDDVKELEWLADQVVAMPDYARGEPTPDFTLFAADGPSMAGNHG